MIRNRVTLYVLLLSMGLQGCLSLGPSKPDEAPNAPPPEPVEEEALAWSDLTRLAREHESRGELDEAQQRLEQASILTSNRRPTDAARRAVFGMRARLAEKLALAGEVDRADPLADELLAMAKEEPSLGGPALISLARSMSQRRSRAALTPPLEDPDDIAEPSHSRLPLLLIAFRVAETGRAGRERMTLALALAKEAFMDRDLPIARRAIERAISDLAIIGPTRRRDLGTFKMIRARIASEQNDLDTALADATAARQIFEHTSAAAALQGAAEAILARVLAKQGQTSQAIEIARRAYARLSDPEPIDASTRRRIVAALARAEASVGNMGQARRYYDEALDIPALDSDSDRHLLREIRIERAALLPEALE